MNPIDELELEVLDLTGDVETAELAGRTAIQGIAAAAVAVAAALGLDPDALAADTLVSLGIDDLRAK